MRLREFMNDKWMLIIGIPLVALIIPLLITGFDLEYLFSEGYRRFLLSITTTVAIWLGVRQIVIFLWNKFPWEKNPWKHLIYEIILVFLYTMLIGYLSYLIYVHTDFVNLDIDFEILPSVAITLLITYLITSIHEAWFFFTQWNISLVKAQALKKENIQSQYETLKNQLNPHFLFNTLNTLTTLIEENQQAAVKYVDKTADFLRSLLNLKDKEVISLEEELEIIQTFYQLQKERFGENLKMEIKHANTGEKFMIPPLALQMLIENAIKHNVISSGNPLHIMIEIKNTGFVSVTNNLQKKQSAQPSSGIGLHNIKNRYSFLSKEEVEIIEKVDSFEVKLPLLIDSEI
ncbi:MAG: sensor histidine kinase [Bacteroidales bacterium]